jgi:hypothetical protein
MRQTLTYMFNQRRWLRLLLVGGYLPFTLVGWLPVSGYLGEALHLALQGHLRRLPPWARWGSLSLLGLVNLALDSIYLVVLPLIFLGGLTLCLSGFVCGLTAYLGNGQETSWPAGVIWFTWILGTILFLAYFLLGIGPISRLVWMANEGAEPALTPTWLLRVARESFPAFWPARRITVLAYLPVIVLGGLGAGLALWLWGTAPLLGGLVALITLIAWAPLWFWSRLVAVRAYGDAAARLGWHKLVPPRT